MERSFAAEVKQRFERIRRENGAAGGGAVVVTDYLKAVHGR